MTNKQLFQQDDETNVDVIAHFDAIAVKMQAHAAEVNVAIDAMQNDGGEIVLYFNDAGGMEEFTPEQWERNMHRFGGAPLWFANRAAMNDYLAQVENRADEVDYWQEQD